jgi:hypothetical protein
MLGIRCPLCEEMVYLTLPDWEDFIGQLDMGQATRIGLVCLNCHNEFLLQVSLSQVIRG